jgi:tetratricopeptide (TPR) repeat protein/transcriptional regulator with XRE-family HTH domain
MANKQQATFGDVLRHARRNADLTQEELAERAGLSVRGISDLERGVHLAPHRDTLEMLADALDLAPEGRRQWARLRSATATKVAASPSLSHLASSSRLVLPPIPGTIVGRERERSMLSGCLDEAIDGRGRLVLISGEAGIGKTTLASVLCREALEQSAVVLIGHCYDQTVTPPYGPWLELTEQYSAGSRLPLLPRVLTRGTGAGHLTSQLELFEVVGSFVTNISAKQPLVVVLEDLHWSDPASLELLRHVGRHVAALPVLLIATYRGDELTRHHPLFQLLPLLVREAQPERIELRPLDNTDIESLVADRYTLAAPDQRRLVAYLLTHAEGNPFFLEELLRTLEAERVLGAATNGWSLGALDQAPVPTLVRQAIEGRLAHLDAETRGMLDIAAVIGRLVPFDLWQAISGADEDRTLDAAERASRAHLLHVDRGGAHVRFAHALTHEALYDGVVPPRRRMWHRRIGEALANTLQPDPDAVAYHFQRASDARAVDWLIQAGERATLSYAWRTAIERFDAAVHLMESDANRAQERCRLLFRLGRLVRWSNPAAGVAYLIDAHHSATAIGDRALEAYALADCGLVRCYAGEILQGIEELAAGVELLETLPAGDVDSVSRQAWTVEGLLRWEYRSNRQIGVGELRPGVNPRRGTLANWLAATGRFTEAIAMASSCLADIASGSIPRDNQDMEAYYALGLAYAELGRPDDARAMLIRAREMYQGIHHPSMVASVTMVLLSRVTIPYCTTALAEREQLAIEAEAAWSEGQGTLPEGLAPMATRAAVLSIAGQWLELQTVFADEAMPLSARFPEWRVLLGQMFRCQGSPARAWEQIRTILPEGPSTGPGGHWFGAATGAQRLAIDLALDAAGLTTAHSWLEAHDRWLAWSGAVRGRAEGQILWARYYHAAGDTAAARDTAQEALRLASDPQQPLALIAAHRFLGQLNTDLSQHAESEAHLGEALRLADACAAPFERALSLLALAELRSRIGQADEAQALLAEVRDICEPLGALPTLQHVDVVLAQLEGQSRQSEQVATG